MLKKTSHNLIAALMAAGSLGLSTASATIIDLTEFGFSVTTGSNSDVVFEDSLSFFVGDFAFSTDVSAPALPSTTLGLYDLSLGDLTISQVFTAEQAVQGVEAFIFFNVDVCQTGGSCFFDDDDVEIIENPLGGTEPAGFQFGFVDDVYFDSFLDQASFEANEGNNAFVGDDIAGAFRFEIPDLDVGETFSLSVLFQSAGTERVGIGASTGTGVPKVFSQQFIATDTTPIPVPGALIAMLTGLLGLRAVRRGQ